MAVLAVFLYLCFVIIVLYSFAVCKDILNRWKWIGSKRFNFWLPLIFLYFLCFGSRNK